MASTDLRVFLWRLLRLLVSGMSEGMSNDAAHAGGRCQRARKAGWGINPQFQLENGPILASLFAAITNPKKFPYHFYRRHRNGEDQFIGALTERRRKPERITHASIMMWAKLIARKDILEERVYFIREEI
jgi:hypothetical protein